MIRRVATQRVVRSVLATVIVAIGIVVAAGYLPGGATPAFADSGNAAVVVVDTGSIVRTVCVHFTANSITGTQALDLAGVDPVYRGYGTTGAAICSLCQQGCPSDSSCLTCGGADYWQYYRSPAGSATYQYSVAGAGATQVHNGDIEGWKWGHSIQPPHVSFESVCGTALQVVPTTLQPQPTTAAPVQTTAAGAASGSGASGSGASAGGNVAAGRSGSSGSATATTAARSGGAASTTTLPGVTTTTPAGTVTTSATAVASAAPGSRTTTTTLGSSAKRALSDPVAPKLPGSKGGGSPLSLVLVGVLVLGLVGSGVYLRIRRRPANS